MTEWTSVDDIPALLNDAMREITLPRRLWTKRPRLEGSSLDEVTRILSHTQEDSTSERNLNEEVRVPKRRFSPDRM